MSWLLATLVPGLLMLATVGLARLEARLNRDRDTGTRAPDPPSQQRAQQRAAVANPLFSPTRRVNRV